MKTIQYIEMVKADQAAIVLSYRQAKAQGMTLQQYADHYEYQNITDAIAYLNEAKRLDATVFNGVDDYDLQDMITVGATKDIGNTVIV